MRLSEAGKGWRWPLAGAWVAGQGLAGAQSPSEAAHGGKDWPLAAGGAA